MIGIPRSGVIVGLLSFLAFFGPTETFAETRKVKFKLDQTPLSAPATKFFSLDMRTLLSDQGSGNLTWSATGDKPGWLTIDSPNSLMKGTPQLSDAGGKSFRLSVQDVEAGAITQVTMTVVVIPIWASDPLDLGIQNEDSFFQLDLKTKVSDPAGGALTFSSTSGLPTWMSLTASGILSGTPRRNDVGNYQDVVLVATTTTGGSSSVKAFGRVLKTIHPPKWISNPQAIADAFEDNAYSKDLDPLVLNFEGTTISFRLVNGPVSGWARISTSGLLTGTPAKIDLGPTTIRAELSTVIDGQSFTDLTDLKFNVIHTNHSPEWKQNPITLPTAPSGSLYTQNLSGSAADVDGDTLTFSFVSGPAWATIQPDGTFLGTPGKSDAGDNVFTAAVSDAEFSPRVTLNLLVTKTNDPPVISTIPPVTMKERETRTLNLASFVTDADGDPLTFTLLSTLDWTVLTTAGGLSLTPKFKDIGDQVVRFRVSDGNLFSDGMVSVKVQRDPRPPVWLEDPIRFTVPFAKPFAANISSKAKDLDGLALTFIKASGPAWLSISNSGDISGTPAKSDIGDNTFRVTVKNDLLGADATLIISVFDPNQAPFWLQDPVTLPNGPEKVPYSQSLASFAKDPDNDALVFSKVSGPSWASVAANGTLTGTPLRTDVGLNTFVVRVTDPGGKSADASVRVTVDFVNQAPRWKVSPLALADAFEDGVYSNDLSPQAEDPDGDSLSFKKISGPSWLAVASDGKISGTPAKGDVGDYSAVFEVSDGKLTAQVTGNGKVIHTNHAPEIGPLPLVTMKERETRVIDLLDFSFDPDGDPITFELLDSQDWAALSGSKLTLNPKFKHIGPNIIRIRVMDGQTFNDGRQSVDVRRDPRPPVWLEDPIRFDAPISKDFAANIKDKAKDLDGLAVSFSKKSGPAWLSIAADGSLSGKPESSDLGQNTFIVTARNDVLGADASIIIRVFDPNQAPFWLQDPLALADAFEDKVYSFDLKPFAKDPEADPLTFKKIDGPNWLASASDGKLSGTPAKTDVGDYTAHFEVSDGKLTAQVTARGKVIHTNHSPVVGTIPPISMKEREIRGVDLSSFVSDSDGDPLSFTLLDTKDWISQSGASLSLTPKFKDIGEHDVRFTVSDGAATAQGIFHVSVVRDPRPPTWLENPIRFTTKAKQPFTAGIKDKAADPDGLPLTFSKVSGPAWLLVANDGSLSGTPQQSDAGDNNFVVTVRNDVLGADATVIVTVEKVNEPPVVDPSLLAFTMKERETQVNDLKKAVTDPEGNPLTFTLKTSSDWAALASDGTLNLKPLFKDIGDHVFVFEVSDGQFTVPANFTVKVLRDPRPPIWLEDPIHFQAAIGKDFSATVAAKAKDLDGLALTFSKKSGPAWLTVMPDGTLSGKPQAADIGDATFVLTVKNDTLGADATVLIQVFDPNQAPFWLQDPLALANAFEDKTYSFDLKPFAKDPDGDSLTFRKLDGPAWLFAGSDGGLSGVPSKNDVGDFTAHFEVSDGKLSAQVTARGKVIHTNHPPVISQISPVTVKERETKTVDLASFVTDSDGDSLTFSLIDVKDWVALSGASVNLTPKFKDIGEHDIRFSVTDGTELAQGTFRVSVVRDPRPPVWLEDPIAFQAAVEKDFSVSVAGKAMDLDGLALSFSKKSGPAWLNVAADGALSGRPKNADIGDATFVLTVKNDALGADATVLIHVFDPNQAPIWLQDPLALADAFEDKTYSFDVKSFAKDPDGDLLTFKKIDGPSWLFVGSEGSLSGVPAKNDVGDFTAHFEVSDGKLSAQVTARGKVLHTNHPPVVAQMPPVTMKERQIQNVDLASFVTDADGDALTFTLVDTNDWVTLNGSNITLSPKFKDIGNHSLPFKVSDGKDSATGVLSVAVVRDPRPPVWLEDPIQFQTKVDQAFSATITGKVKDLDGIALTFTKSSGPDWLTVGSDGSLSGTPKTADLGDNTFVVTAKNDLLGANANVIVTVFDPNQPPVWLQDPVTLPNAPEKQLYTQSLTGFVKDPDGDILKFTKLSGPAWATVTETGTFTGVPARSDVGLNTFKIRVTDPGGKSADATVLVTVDLVNQGPKWTQDPIPLGEVPIEEAFQFDLTPFASDPDGDPLTFKISNGPAWLQINNGKLIGTPHKTDIGEFAATVTVSDGVAEASAGVFGKVFNPINHPPSIPADKLFFVMKERGILDVNLNTPDFVIDPDGDLLRFKLEPVPAWVTLTFDGKLGAQPKHGQLGDHTFKLTVTDERGLSSEAPLFIRVLPDPLPPEWLENPIRYSAKVGVQFSANVGDKVKDPDGMPITISKASGAVWLQVGPNGQLSGLPASQDVGENQFLLEASNGSLSAFTTVLITVSSGQDQTDTVQVDQAVPGAPTENLWVIDNSAKASCDDELAQLLKAHITVYNNALTAAQVHHNGVFLGTNAQKYDGVPIKSKAGAWLLKWDDNNWSTDYRYRTDQVFGREGFNSPLWSMFRFYTRLPSISDLYQHGFTEREVPAEVMIVTRQKDIYSKYSDGTAQSGWGPLDYSKFFRDFHGHEKKSYRISAISPDCPAAPQVAENAYQTLVRETGGTYYPYACPFKMDDTLKDYAQKVVFRAYVEGKRTIPLSKKPLQPSKIQLFIAGKVVLGNTGSIDDKWFYDNAQNAVIMQWHLIDVGTLKPGDKIEIRYQF